MSDTAGQNRRVCLIRHAMPELPLGERWCVGGRTDLPLGTLGRLQATLLRCDPRLSGLQVFCSSMRRARETALALTDSPRIMPGLEEQDMGVWDGLSFQEIEARFPALYAARERDLSVLPDGAESLASVEARVRAALLNCLRESEGDIAVVSHKSCIASQLGSRAGLDYAAVSVLDFDGDRLSPLLPPVRFIPPPDEALCLSLLEAAGLGDETIAHCRAVAALAAELCDALTRAGLALDRERIVSAALLHDIARLQPEHPRIGALWLRELGYPELAELVRQHHDLDNARLDEAGLVFLADKAVAGTRRVALRERFSASEKKCTTPQARAAHARRLETALKLQNEIRERCGEQLLP